MISLSGLTVSFGGVTVVRDVSLAIAAGECLALVGESGSGKSVTARTLVGLTGHGAAVSVDAFTFDGASLAGAREKTWRPIRGGQIGFVLQDALSSLDPLRKVGDEIAEPLRLHGSLTRAQRAEKVLALLESVGVPEPERRAAQYPHQLSGGLRQRALIASAIACSPKLLIADEPTTALDATIQAQILDLLASLKRSDTGMLIVSHDLSVVAKLADRVAVMRRGTIVEEGPTQAVLSNPQHDYTKALLAAVPSRRTHRDLPGGQVLSVSGLGKSYDGRTVVNDVSFHLDRGETVGIVGESGSGKTTTARLLLGLEKPDSGSVTAPPQRRQMQFVYQDPLSSFDPRYTVARIIGEAVAVSGLSGTARRERIVSLLEQVRLDASYLKRRPLELSGGERQRVAIARALAPSPDVIVCDEPVSALDVSVQSQILDLLADLQDTLGIAYVFISHDLGVIRHLSDRVLVMKDGAVVEADTVSRVFGQPQHPYTRELLAAVL